MNNYSKILHEAYEKFLLPIGGKIVPTPYRINDKGNFQKLGPEFQGKSSPQVLTKTVKKLAQQQMFDLDKASIAEIRNFMRKNKLGIDCSGFTYRILNYLVQKVKGKPLTSFGLPHVGRCNVEKLTSSDYTRAVGDLSNSKPGDLIRLWNKHGGLHCLVVFENQKEAITYTQSSEPLGINMGKFKNGGLPKHFTLRRLKILLS